MLYKHQMTIAKQAGVVALLLLLGVNITYAKKRSEPSTAQIISEIEKNLLISTEKDRGDISGARLSISRGKWVLPPGVSVKPGLTISPEEISVAESRITELYDIAYLSAQSGQFEAAITAYNQILKKYPNDKYALFGLATSYQNLGQYQQAKPIYLRLLKMTPDDMRVVSNLLAIINEENPAEAATLLAGIAERNPQMSFVLAQTGTAYGNIGNDEKAIEYFTRAFSLEPDNIQYKYNLAVLFDKTKNYSGAARLYQEILDEAIINQNLAFLLPIQSIEERLRFIKNR